MESFEEYWMKGLRVDSKNFEGELTFENCSKYFDLAGERAVWDYQQKKIDKLVEALKLYVDEHELSDHIGGYDWYIDKGYFRKAKEVLKELGYLE